MTPEEIDALPAGPELDALVEKLVIRGGTWVGLELGGKSYVSTDDSGTTFRIPPPYSTNESAARQVLKHFPGFNVYWGIGYRVQIPVPRGNFAEIVEAVAMSRPLAIARAALKAKAAASDTLPRTSSTIPSTAPG